MPLTYDREEQRLTCLKCNILTDMDFVSSHCNRNKIAVLCECNRCKTQHILIVDNILGYIRKGSFFLK